MTAAITFAGVQKNYGAQKVLTGIDLTVNAGEYLGLIGVNGAGKSTLMKCMLDFSSPTSGKIQIFSIDNGQTESRNCLSYLPEKFIPPYYLTGRDFLQFMASLYSITLEEKEVQTILGLLDFDSTALNKSVGQLSKGMAQKIGLAACLLSKKELLVLDEPMSGLDPKARAHLKQHFLELKKQGQTLFFSTHMLNDVEVLCDRVAILHEGKIRFIGTPQECCVQYHKESLEQAYLSCVATC